MAGREVIVKVGAAGGSLTLFGIRDPSGWRFQFRVLDNTPDLIDEPMIDRMTEWVDSWSKGLSLLDRYQWFRLHPMRVHPEFRVAVLAAVAERMPAELDRDALSWSLWVTTCEESGEAEG